MHQNEAKQLTWDLLIASKRLAGEGYGTPDRRMAIKDLHGDLLEEYGHYGFDAAAGDR